MTFPLQAGCSIQLRYRTVLTGAKIKETLFSKAFDHSKYPII
jgi:hypothetical protein